MMKTTDATSPSKRSFPELRDFLESEVLGVEFPVKHLIEQARSKGYISKGKPGRGGAKVTSRDVAVLLAGAMSGETPQVATDNMALIRDLNAGDTSHTVHFPAFGDAGSEWWECSFVDAITYLLDLCREDPDVNLDPFTITLTRAPVFAARISWEDLPWEKDASVFYSLSSEDYRAMKSKGRRLIQASISGDLLRYAAFWLEDRGFYCDQDAPYNNSGAAL